LTQDVQDDASSKDERSSGRFPLFGGGLSGANRARDEQRTYRVQEIEVDGLRLSLGPAHADDVEIRVLKPEFSGYDNSTRG
ncbi:MAG: hypothetical protein KDB01_01305, partial [Planctomycetaceae bacterium]|nr:hypothetical protein [Planctomycetaceae bacterium]